MNYNYLSPQRRYMAISNLFIMLCVVLVYLSSAVSNFIMICVYGASVLGTIFFIIHYRYFTFASLFCFFYTSQFTLGPLLSYIFGGLQQPIIVTKVYMFVTVIGISIFQLVYCLLSREKKVVRLSLSWKRLEYCFYTLIIISIVPPLILLMKLGYHSTWDSYLSSGSLIIFASILMHVSSVLSLLSPLYLSNRPKIIKYYILFFIVTQGTYFIISFTRTPLLESLLCLMIGVVFLMPIVDISGIGGHEYKKPSFIKGILIIAPIVVVIN